MWKEILKYTLIIVGVFVLVRVYDWVTKKPTPIERAVDPRILRLDSEITAIHKELELSAKERAVRDLNINSRLDSIRIDRQKANNEKKKLYKIPDASLIHYRDSIRRANGL